ncbi:hypothetical protein CRG98_015986 [Punica granatum]|uniref:Uncharacterized protein n=1 Tax=Punica granatum TaxID=22663 RepID=A0A2I0K649_PUNGR|nr:hypothetical protein CRG98_015986 [Punica granatum]
MIKGGKEGQDDLSGGGRIRQTKPIARAHGRTDSIVLIVSEAVRTSVLFSRWRYKQTTLPELVFDDDCTPSSFDDESSALRMEIRAAGDSGGPPAGDTLLGNRASLTSSQGLHLGDRSP